MTLTDTTDTTDTDTDIDTTPTAAAEPTTPTSTVTTITLPAPELGRMLANATLATLPKKDARPLLSCIHLSYSEGTLTATATDSYWLLRETIPVEGDGLAFVTLLSAEDLAPVIKAAKARLTAQLPAVIIFDGGRVTFRVDTLTVTVTEYPGEFPNVSHIIGAHTQNDVGKVAFMSALLTRVAKVVPSSSPEKFGYAMRFTFNSALSGARVDWRSGSDSECAELFAIVMPTQVRS